MNVFHPLDFTLVQRDDYLPANLMIDFLLFAKGLHRLLPLTAIDGLQGTRLVIDARMKNTGIVTRLVNCQVSFLLQDYNVLVGMAFGQAIRGGKSHYADAQDTDVTLHDASIYLDLAKGPIEVNVSAVGIKDLACGV